MKIARRAVIAGAAAVTAVSSEVRAVAQPVPRREPGEVSFSTTEGKRIIAANGQTAHAIGDFPNAHDPVPIMSQQYRLEMPLKPQSVEKPVTVGMWLFGVGVNGDPFDPSGPLWSTYGRSGCPPCGLPPGVFATLLRDTRTVGSRVRLCCFSSQEFWSWSSCCAPFSAVSAMRSSTT